MLIVHEDLDTANNRRDVVQTGSFFGHVSCALCDEHRFAHFHAGHTDPIRPYYIAAICEPCAEQPETVAARIPLRHSATDVGGRDVPSSLQGIWAGL